MTHDKEIEELVEAGERCEEAYIELQRSRIKEIEALIGEKLDLKELERLLTIYAEHGGMPLEGLHDIIDQALNPSEEK